MDILGHDLIAVVGVIILISIEYLCIFVGMYYYLYHKPRKLNIINNPTIKRENFNTNKAYKNALRGDKVLEYTNKITVIILRENKWSKILYFSGEKESFTYEKCLYFITTPHSCDNGAKLLVYLEGISLPLSYENVQKEQVKRKYLDLDGKTKEVMITVIKGLKWDGKILHIFTNRKFAEIFTKVQPDMLPLLILIIVVSTLIVSCIGIGVTYFV